MHFFGESVTPRLMEDLFSRFQNPIHELELLPVLVASFLWVEMFQHSQVVYFIDNESPEWPTYVEAVRRLELVK